MAATQTRKVDRPKMRMFYTNCNWLSKTIQIYSLAILMKYCLKENKLLET